MVSKEIVHISGQLLGYLARSTKNAINDMECRGVNITEVLSATAMKLAGQIDGYAVIHFKNEHASKLLHSKAPSTRCFTEKLCEIINNEFRHESLFTDQVVEPIEPIHGDVTFYGIRKLPHQMNFKMQLSNLSVELFVSNFNR